MMCNFKIGDTYKVKKWLYDNLQRNDDSVPVLGEFKILQAIEDNAFSYRPLQWHWIAEKDGQAFLLRAIVVSGYSGGVKYQADPINTDALCFRNQQNKGEE